MHRLLAVTAAAILALSAESALAQRGPDIEAWFAQADVHHTGAIKRADFAASRVSRFQQLDRNHDGYLDEADFPQGLGMFRPKAARIGRMLAMFDTDHDDRISLNEFIAGSMHLFDEADTNHDGVLTLAEARAAQARFKAMLGGGR